MLGGFVPSLLFTRVNTIRSLKNLPSLISFPHINLRKGLVAVQYTFSLLFISVTLIGYTQYMHFVTFDPGFKTDQIVNIDSQGKNPDLLINELKKIPEVIELSRSNSIISPDSYSRILAKYGAPPDSTEIDYNVIDENYLSVHEFKILAGSNFSSASPSNSVIVNEQFLKSFQIDATTPHTILGTIVLVNRKPHEIVGVVKDFYYGGAEKLIGPYLFMYSDKANQFINVKILSSSGPALTKLENAWRVIDPTHPLNAVYYSDQLERGYNDIAALLKIIGFLAVITVSIASLGLIGIVVFSTASRLKEIGIRKVFGSSTRNIIFILSKEYLLLLGVPAALALPATFAFFDKIVLSQYAYHAPLTIAEFATSVIIVFGIAVLVIGLQTSKAALANPIMALRNE